jgi:hypothetical protein
VVIWSLLEYWAEPLGYAAPLVVALAIAFTAAFVLGGIVAAAMGLLAGERPRAVGIAALVANGAVALWMMGWGG